MLTGSWVANEIYVQKSTLTTDESPIQVLKSPQTCVVPSGPLPARNQRLPAPGTM
jgi:hypothetical protein